MKAPAASYAAHTPVFLNSILQVFRTVRRPVHAIFDGTFGRGGHGAAMLDAWPEAQLIAFDWDEEAIDFAKERFSSDIASGRLRLYRSSYLDFWKLREEYAARGFPQSFDLMLLDLGVSSPQLDQAERGFSFYQEGPLDMRMDRRGELTAADIVNTWDEQELARLFIEYGEIQRPFRVARAIVHDRKARKPFQSTRELAAMIERVEGWRRKGSHPATRFFLALRMRVNDELSTLNIAIPDMIKALAEGGMLAVITFHSLEDRIIKTIFKDHLNVGHLVNKKVMKPTDEEIRENPRARSAKLRVFGKGPP